MPRLARAFAAFLATLFRGTITWPYSDALAFLTLTKNAALRPEVAMILSSSECFLGLSGSCVFAVHVVLDLGNCSVPFSQRSHLI